jgi:hypothetical protein
MPAVGFCRTKKLLASVARVVRVVARAGLGAKRPARRPVRASHERLELAGSSQRGIQVGRRKPVIQESPTRKILTASPTAGLGRVLTSPNETPMPCRPTKPPAAREHRHRQAHGCLRLSGLAQRRIRRRAVTGRSRSIPETRRKLSLMRTAWRASPSVLPAPTYLSVTAPSEALETSFAYLASTPRV